jgi:hypothetical protein
MRIPTLLLEHPVEAAIAGLLLLALLFVSADPSSTNPPAGPQIANSQKI